MEEGLDEVGDHLHPAYEKALKLYLVPVKAKNKGAAAMMLKISESISQLNQEFSRNSARITSETYGS